MQCLAHFANVRWLVFLVGCEEGLPKDADLGLSGVAVVAGVTKVLWHFSYALGLGLWPG